MPDIKGKPTVPAVARAARALEVVSDAPNGLTLSEISRAIGAPKSSCLSVCTTLVEAGLLARSDTGSYLLGMRLPAHCTASGKSLLAALPIAELDALYADNQFDVLTQHSIASKSNLNCDLDNIRNRHFAIDDEETALGMICVGAAVTDSFGRPVGALSVSMVKATVDQYRGKHAAESLLRMAHALTARLGGPVHAPISVESVPLANRRP